MERKSTRMAITAAAVALCLCLAVTACANEPAPSPAAPPQASVAEEPEVDVEALKGEVVAHYANGVHALYSQSLASARAMDTASTRFWPILIRRAWKPPSGPGSAPVMTTAPPRCSGSTAAPSTTKRTGPRA